MSYPGDLCSKCGELNDRVPQRYCRLCFNDYNRLNRTKYSDLSPEAKRKLNARAYANEYQRRGKLTPKPCEKCGDIKAEKHHDNYDKPLQITWLCRGCHRNHHTEEAAKVSREALKARGPVEKKPVPVRTKCPECQTDSRVLQTRKREAYIYRRYVCAGGHRFSTVATSDGEVVCDPGMAKVIRKSDIIRAIKASM